MDDDFRRNMALFSMSSVMKLTDLTARQIRYYEQHELIAPERTPGNQRLFSFNDVDRLLRIKALIEKGVNIAGIKQVLNPEAKQEQQEEAKMPELTDPKLHKLLRQQLLNAKRPGQVSLIQGELSRFFHS